MVSGACITRFGQVLFPCLQGIYREILRFLTTIFKRSHESGRDINVLCAISLRSLTGKRLHKIRELIRVYQG